MVITNRSLTPLQLLQQYHNLSVDIPGADETTPAQIINGIKLNHYFITYTQTAAQIQNWRDAIAENNEDEVITPAERRENRQLTRQINKANQDASLHALRGRLGRRQDQEIRLALRETRYGKGLPQHYEIFLEVAVQAGLCNRRGEQPTAASIQTFMDSCGIGIDCSGFVSAYFVCTGQLAETTSSAVNRLNAGAWGRRTNNVAIEEIKDISMGDCFVETDRRGNIKSGIGHIMLANNTATVTSVMNFTPVDLKTGQGGQYAGMTSDTSSGNVYVVESRGSDGLHHGPAEIETTTHGTKKFFILRRHGRSRGLPCIVVRPSFS